jgi:hypothetical protein
MSIPEKTSYGEILGIALILVCHLVIERLPYGNGIYFGYSPYLKTDLISTGVAILLGLLLSCLLLFKTYAHKTSIALLKKLFLALVCSATIKLFFSLASTPWEAIPSSILKNDSFIEKFLWNYSLPIIIFLVLLFQTKVQTALARLLASCGYVFLLLILYRFLMGLDTTYIPSWGPNPTIKTENKITKQVVWIVFDEFDPEIAFSSNELARLPNFSELLKESVYFKHNYSPAGNTIAAIPAMLVGTGISRVVTNTTSKLTIVSDGNQKISFNYENSIFSRLRYIGINSEILGFYHPYCEIFKTVSCRAFSYSIRNNWYSGAFEVIFGRKPLKYIDRIDEGTVEPMGYITKQQLAYMPEFLANEDSAFKFLHLNIPHLPANFAEKEFNKKGLDLQQKYLLNLELSDLVLKKIMDEINKKNGIDTLLILSSDHWFRERNDADGKAHPALLIAKLSNSNDQIEEYKKTSSANISDLVYEYFMGNILTHKDIDQFITNKPFHTPYLPK